MSKLKYILNRYKFVLLFTCILIFLLIFYNDLGVNTFNNAKSSFLQMISVLPPIMLLLGLMDEWVSRESMMKYMGEGSSILGIVLSIALAAFAAGPMYAAFPFTAVLMKKGVKFSNIIIFMNSWCVIKISTLLFEIGALGYKFTFLRLLIDIPGVIIMGYIVDYIVNRNVPIEKGRISK
ncbi:MULTISPECIES: permease [unclassified Romboutsia]|uniref:permease n=1 Tax=unclassified Romboutsia TaxID=2626894 RepID=UPI00082058C2|nr:MULTISPECIES: permease [unclassified Romboutsia]SCI15451.1 Predicted permease [uncultured Clostridium sp.]